MFFTNLNFTKMKKKFFIHATIAIAYVATATAKTSWPTESWPGESTTEMSKYPSPMDVEPVGSWPTL